MFHNFQQAVHTQFESMKQSKLFRMAVDKDDLWNFYLDAFPEGTNNIFRERREYDCQCCKQFIRQAGAMVTFQDNKIVTLWDIEVEGYYQTVANKMAEYLRTKMVDNVYLHTEKKIGAMETQSLKEDGSIERWQHFYCELPIDAWRIDPASKLGTYKTNFKVLQRSLNEIPIEALETVIDLIDQGSLYRGDEMRRSVAAFAQTKLGYDHCSTDRQKEIYTWTTSLNLGANCSFRNTAIGSLVTDIAKGMDLESAVRSFEAKVAPSNYKRPKALITQKMIDSAQKKVAELGYETSLQRRFAKADDITINNVLFADRSVKPAMGVFDSLKSEVKPSQKQLDRVDSMSVEDFINKVVPKAESIELLTENKHTGNFFSLIAPSDPDSKNMLKWDNNFTWTYSGDVTDSIKEHVKAAGGCVEAEFRCSLAWYSQNDLDLHLVEPNGNRIMFSNKLSRNGKGRLDVDNTRGGTKDKPAVENIYWTKKSDMSEGRYQVMVHNYSRANRNEAGFDFEFEFMGDIVQCSFQNEVRQLEMIDCLEFEYSHANGIQIIRSLPSTKASKEVWGVNTEVFNKVTMIMNSPNHWDGEQTGNKHYFFVLDKCNSGDKGRGIYNEFLSDELREHRKVFEVLGNRLKAEESDEQLSGLGFSSTIRNEAYFKVSGSFNRTVKVQF
jgi:hypothetical protein